MAHLTDALVGRGHEVVLSASADSRTAHNSFKSSTSLIPFAPQAIRQAERASNRSHKVTAPPSAKWRLKPVRKNAAAR